MVVRKQTIRFNADRVPIPKKIRVGYEGDHLAERLEFVLPSLSQTQTAFLMIGGEDANVVKLMSEGLYYVDLTAEMLGMQGVIDCYVRLDDTEGRSWNSSTFRLIVGDVPDVEIELNREYPTAVGQMIAQMAAHDARMDEQSDDMGRLLDEVRLASERVVSSAEAAQAASEHAENSEQNAAKNAQDAQTAAENSANNAACAEAAAAASLESSESAASSAENAIESASAARMSCESALSSVTAAEDSARRSESYALDAKAIFDKMCPSFEMSGLSVVCTPIKDSELDVSLSVVAVQDGSGNASPDNVRPISGHEGAVLRVNDATYEAQFGQTVYGGVYDWTRGVLTVTHGVLVLTGEESFSVSGKVYYHVHSGESGALENGACSHFRCETGAAYNARYPDSVEVRAARLWVYAARFETAAELKAYLAAQYAAGTPVIVVYPLEEVHEVQLIGAAITAPGGDVLVTASTGEVIVRGVGDLAWMISWLTARVAALEAAVVNGN